MQISFIQSNWLRQYPFQDGNGEVDLNSNVMPASLIVGLRITCLGSDLELYINKVVINLGLININFAGSNGDIGYAGGAITEDNQSLTIYSYANGGAIGNVMIGDASLVKTQQTYLFNSSNGAIEPSTVIVMPVPGVFSLYVLNKSPSYTGDVEFVSKTINITTAGSDIFWSVLNPSAITSRQDNHAELLTCNNTVISGINTVIPDASGNIDIYAIAPLAVAIQVVDGRQQLVFSTPGLGLDETDPVLTGGLLNLCKLANIPPTNTSNTYGTAFSSITTTTLPEYESWPQYE